VLQLAKPYGRNSASQLISVQVQIAEVGSRRIVRRKGACEAVVGHINNTERGNVKERWREKTSKLIISHIKKLKAGKKVKGVPDLSCKGVIIDQEIH
jgi:hypothetical protein